MLSRKFIIAYCIAAGLLLSGPNLCSSAEPLYHPDYNKPIVDESEGTFEDDVKENEDGTFEPYRHFEGWFRPAADWEYIVGQKETHCCKYVVKTNYAQPFTLRVREGHFIHRRSVPDGPWKLTGQHENITFFNLLALEAVSIDKTHMVGGGAALQEKTDWVPEFEYVFAGYPLAKETLTLEIECSNPQPPEGYHCDFDSDFSLEVTADQQLSVELTRDTMPTDPNYDKYEIADGLHANSSSSFQADRHELWITGKAEMVFEVGGTQVKRVDFPKISYRSQTKFEHLTADLVQKKILELYGSTDLAAWQHYNSVVRDTPLDLPKEGANSDKFSYHELKLLSASSTTSVGCGPTETPVPIGKFEQTAYAAGAVRHRADYILIKLASPNRRVMRAKIGDDPCLRPINPSWIASAGSSSSKPSSSSAGTSSSSSSTSSSSSAG
jgi:hypothetical protein